MSICENAKLFDKSMLPARTPLGALTQFDDSLLRARGFDKDGNRIGGIAAPVQVLVPPATILVRGFGGDSKPMGQWWFTLYELNEILNYVGHTDVAEGRQAGKGVLHAYFAVLLKKWNATSEYFILMETLKPLCAFYGEGDHSTFGAAGGQKVALVISKGVQRGVRQIMLPSLWDFPSAVVVRVPQGNTDQDLVRVCQGYPIQILPFEV